MGSKPAPGIVYTTGLGAICPGCRRPVADCACRRADGRPARDQVVRVSREMAGRKGKGVSVVTGLDMWIPLRFSRVRREPVEASSIQ